jgi:hypothetical protein
MAAFDWLSLPPVDDEDAPAPLAGEMRLLLSVLIQSLKDTGSPTRPIRLGTP